MSRRQARRTVWVPQIVIAWVLLPLAASASSAAEPNRGDVGATISAQRELTAGCIERVEDLVKQDHQAHSLIVVIPDPALTPFAREFDIFLLAIQQAMAARDLHLDKSCLVWRTGSGEAEHSSVGQRPRSDPQPPGLLVYRGRLISGVDVVYALLVVGEAPPAGVAPAAMKEALDLAAKGWRTQESMPAGPADPPPVTILGPTFSGSARSLGLALRRWEPAIPERKCAKDPVVRQKVTIVSGSATNTGLNTVIRDAIGKERLEELDLSPFRSVATSNDDLQSCLWNRVVPERVGLLTRWSNRSSVLCPPNERPPNVDDQNEANKQVALLVELSAFGREFTESDFKVITFPPHLGALRNAYESLEKTRAQAGSAKSAEEEIMLMTNLTGRLQHGISMFGQESTLSSLDLVLNNSLRKLARERVRVVGIIATNVADKIFLAEKVRRYVPDVRMVTIEGDVLLSHPRHHPSTSGMLVASSSSMAISDPTRVQFDFDWAHGVYLATRQVVAKELDIQSLVADERPKQHEVHVSVVSRTGLSPLEIISGSPVSNSVQERKEDVILAAGFRLPWWRGGPEDSLPIIWRSLVYLVSCLLLLVVYACVRAFEGQKPLLGIVPFELIDWRQWKQAGTQERDHLLHALVALLPVAIGVVFLVVSFPSFYSVGFDSLTTPLCLFLLAIGALYLWVGLAVRTGQALFQVFRETPRSVLGYAAALLPGLLVAGGIVAIIVCTVQAVVWFSKEDVRSRELLVDRLLSLSGGVSPLVPVALIASVIVAWLVVALRWREVQPLAVPTAQDDPAPTPPESPLAESSRTMWLALDLLAHGRMKLGVWAAAVLVPMLYLATLFGAPPLRGIEDWEAVDWATTMLLATALLLALGSALSAVLGWWRLRDLLEVIASRPLLGVTELPRSRKPLELAPLRKALASVAAPDEPTKELASASEGELTLTWWHAAARWLDGAEARPAGDLHDLVARLFRQATGRLVRLAYRQLGTLMTYATVALITLFLAIGAYPFEPRRMVLLYLGLLVVAVATVSVTIVLQSRNEPLLENVTGADGSWASKGPLVQQLGFYAGLPVFGLLTARFSELRGFLGQWLDPIIMALK